MRGARRAGGLELRVWSGGRKHREEGREGGPEGGREEDPVKQRRSQKKEASCLLDRSPDKSPLAVTRDDLKIQLFGDNVQNAVVREVRFLVMKTRLAFCWRARQEGLLHPAPGR